MANTSKQDLRRALFESLRPRLARREFKLRLSENDFVRRHDGFCDRFILSFNSFDTGYDITPILAVSVDRVERLLDQSSLNPKFRKGTSTISTAVADLFSRDQWKVSLTLRSNSDIAPLTGKLVEVFERIALLYFRRWASLHAIDEGLNKDAKGMASLRPFEWSRCSAGIIVARLVGRADYEQLAAQYTMIVTKEVDCILKEFLQSLEILKSVEPWSGVPAALGCLGTGFKWNFRAPFCERISRATQIKSFQGTERG